MRTPTQWADTNRRLPDDAGMPGPWQTSVTPYVVAPGEAALDLKYKRVFICMMAQGGKSQLLFNLIGYKLDDDPAPILYIGPTKTNIVKVVEPKIDAMLRSTPSLWAKTVKGQKYTTTKKLVSGTSLRFAWAGSVTELKADNACWVLIDEIEEINIEVRGQGSIIPLADARHKSFDDGKTIGASTPTEGNISTYKHKNSGLEHWSYTDPEQVGSVMWRLWQEGTKQEWAWPCFSCKKYFIPRFKNLVWPKKCTPVLALTETRLECPNCKTTISNDKKEKMNASGLYISPGQRVSEDGTISGDVIDSVDATFWVSGLANPFATWGEMASNWLRAVRSQDFQQMRGVLNTDFAECFKVGGDVPSFDVVLKLKNNYAQNTIPKGVRGLLASADVHKSRINYVVRGWGSDLESWLIEEGELYGDIQKPDIWEQLQSVLDTEFEGYNIKAMFIDSGYMPLHVYEFCYKNKGRAFPTKGHDKLSKPYYSSKIDVTINGRVRKNSLLLWHFDSDLFKTWVHSRLELPVGMPGRFHLHADVSDDYCKQLINESRVVTTAGKITWIKSGNNHFLDCEALNILGAKILRVDKIKDVAAL